MRERRFEIVGAQRSVGRKLRGRTIGGNRMGVDNDVSLADRSGRGIVEDARARSEERRVGKECRL